MDEKKLTDEEVVSALICCGITPTACAICPLSCASASDCGELIDGALDLINRLQSEKAEQKAEIERLTEENGRISQSYIEVCDINAELQKQVDELKEKIMNLKSAMIDRVARKSYDSLLTTPDDVEEIFGDAYESEFNKFLGQAVKDTAREILQGFMSWLNQAIGVSYDKSVKGSVQAGGMNVAFHEVKELVKKVAESKGVEELK